MKFQEILWQFNGIICQLFILFFYFLQTKTNLEEIRFDIITEMNSFITGRNINFNFMNEDGDNLLRLGTDKYE